MTRQLRIGHCLRSYTDQVLYFHCHSSAANDMQRNRIARLQVDRYTAHNLRLIEDPLEATVQLPA